MGVWTHTIIVATDVVGLYSNIAAIISNVLLVFVVAIVIIINSIETSNY